MNNSSDFNQTGNVWTNRGLGVVVPRSCCRFKNKTGSDWSGVIPNITSVNGYPECPTSPNAENSFFNLVNISSINFCFLLLKTKNKLLPKKGLL